MERTYIDTLAQLIARSPTCYHAAATAAELLAAAGYAPLDEGQRWQLRPGGKYYMTRGTPRRASVWRRRTGTPPASS